MMTSRLVSMMGLAHCVHRVFCRRPRQHLCHTERWMAKVIWLGTVMKSALTRELKSVAATAVLVSKRENLAKINQVDRFRSV